MIGPEALTAVATLLLVGVGTWQITEIREEAKKERTLAACNRYDTDQLLDQSVRRFSAAQKNGWFAADPSKFKSDAVFILNYLDSIAIGIAQNVYSESLARDHIGPILCGYVEDLLDQTIARELGISAESFAHLMVVYNRWLQPEIWECEISN